MHYALPIMARQGSGAVVNTASVSGLAGDYAHGAYNAAKFAVVGITKTAAIEYARYGVPITFFSTGGHRDYHQVTDEPEYIDYDHMARIASFIEEATARLLAALATVRQ